MKKLNAVLKAIDKISEITGKCASWLMIVVTLIILYEVIARTVFGAPTVWAFELSIMLWGTYFVSVMAWTHKEGGHIAVDVIYNRFSTRMKAILDLTFCLLLCFTLVAFLTKAGIDFAATSWELLERTGSPWNPPIYPLKTTLPIGFALLGLQCLARFICDIMILIGRQK
ncbi:TRAP transporter small permease subunit [Dehalococcoidia bacterium]|nr:TRAP transporter small permease subunit [Dehalococcoidia bacterium]